MLSLCEVIWGIWLNHPLFQGVGIVVRIVTAIVEVLLERSQVGRSINKDQTNFWRKPRSSENKIGSDLDGVVALTKFFVLEWSQELDYQLYHQLPVTVYLA
jgi:hypothetical protein